ncbi:MAG: class I SAM-dependent methyltransferase [Planctomycetota bacterium]
MPIELVPQDCPLCKCRESTAVCQIADPTYGVEGSFQVVHCRECRHLFLNPRPSDSSLMDCYPQNYAPYELGTNDEAAISADARTTANAATTPDVDPTAGGQDENGQSEPQQSAPPWRRVLRVIPGLRSFLFWLGQEHATVLPSPPSSGKARLLEIGCAHGGYLERAKEAGWTVDGVEPNEAAAKTARNRGLQVASGFLHESEIGKDQRECVVMWMVLEHVPDPKETLERISEILDEGGTLVFSVPNAATWERWLFGRFWLGYDAPRHLQVFSAKSVSRLLRDCGFSEIRIIHQANSRYWWGSIAAWGAVRFPNRTWPARWMEYFKNEPPRYWNWLLVIPAKLSALLRCSGRITVVAKNAKHEKR